MAVTMAEITKLRTMTGAGMMDCKNALTEANGDMDLAIELIRKRGQAIAAKRSDREASEGCVLAQVKDGFGAIVALKCETDFVAKNADFIALTQQILDKALETKVATLEALNAVEIGGRSISDLVTERSGVTGEKMEIGYYEIAEGATVVEYIHPGNKLATLVARDIAMQAAAMNPISLDRASVPAKVVEGELKVGREKAREEGKPEAMLEKIAEGRLNKFYQESTLIEQAFIKDAKITVGAYAKANNATPTAFKRVTLNEE